MPQVVFLCAIWIVVGCVISAPYTYLAGGGVESFFTTVWLSPVAAIILFIAYVMKGISRCDKELSREWKILFWGLATYFCLPIVLNSVSHLLEWLGYKIAAEYVFAGRFVSLIVVLAIIVLCYAVVACVMSVRQWFINKTSNNPPSNNGLNLETMTEVSPGEDGEVDTNTFQFEST